MFALCISTLPHVYDMKALCNFAYHSALMPPSVVFVPVRCPTVMHGSIATAKVQKAVEWLIHGKSCGPHSSLEDKTKQRREVAHQ